jgi:elongation factor G
MKREYKAEVVTSPPQVAYRETISKKVEFNYTHKKQTGGSGQYGRVAGFVEPFDGEFEFVDEIKGGSIPREFIPSCEKGFKSMLMKSPRLGVPVTGLRVTIDDGQSHQVDSSDIAFQEAARGAFRDFFPRAAPKILEPIMKLSVEGPAEFSGNILSTIMQRRGVVIGSTEEDGMCRVDAEVPLSEMFGYSTPLRSSTQGKAEFTMEFAKYAETPSNITEELLAKAAKAKAEASKK